MRQFKRGNRFKVFIPSKIMRMSQSIRQFHEKIVEVTSLSNQVEEIAATLIDPKTGQKTGIGTWFHPTWLLPIDPKGKCICPLNELLLKGCKCGGE